MQKIINILIIAILSVIFIGLIVFGVSFGKDILTKENTKTESAAKNKESKKDKKENIETDNSQEINTSTLR